MSIGSSQMPSVPPPQWSLWQRIVGWIRQALNVGNAAGLWPSRGPLDKGRDDRLPPGSQ